MKSFLSRRWACLGPLLAIVLPCLALYWRFIAGWLPIGTDNSLFLIPSYTLRWDEGLPLWNAYYLTGMSMFDNLQFSILYPLRWPFFFVADWSHYYGLFLLLHYLVSAGGTWCLLRGMRLDRLSTLAGVIAFVVGGHMAGRVINPMLLYSTSWLPLLFWSALGRTPLHRWGTTVAMVMLFTVGQPHTLFYGPVGFALVFFFFQSGLWSRPEEEMGVPEPKSSLAGFLRYSVVVGAHVVLAFVLASPSLLIGLQHALQSVRSRTDLATNLADPVSWEGLPTVFLGGSGGTVFLEYIDKSCFIGSIGVLLLFSVGLRRDSWRDPRFLCGLLLTAVGVLFALGPNVGLQYVMPYIPGYSSLVGPARGLMLTAVGLAILVGLAIERLQQDKRIGTQGGIALGLGSVFLALFLLLADRFPAATTLPPGWSGWLRAWAEKPEAAGLGAFLIVDAAEGFLLAGGVLLAFRRKPRLAVSLLVGLLFLQLWHFSPRVFPPTRRADYYDPPEVIHTLQTLRDAVPERPFRVDAHDPLRLHDTDFGYQYNLHYLIPNYSVIFRLEGLSGFDPMAPLRFLELVEQTAGRCPFNNPLRAFTTARPDERLYDLTGVRYLVGHPYDRRVSTLPQALTPQERVQPVEFWETPEKFNLPQDFDRTQPITHWLFLSQVDAAVDFPAGTQMATLHVEAQEGRFSFPVRYGIETGPMQAYYLDQRKKMKEPGPVLNARWSVPTLDPEMDYQMNLVNYRGLISFGQPLHVKRLTWELVSPRGQNQSFVLFVGAQACRLAPPAQNDPWRLVSGDENQPAPLFEYRNAPARATRVDWPSPDGASTETLADVPPTPSAADIRVNEAFLRQPQTDSDPVFVERHTNRALLRSHGDRAQILVLRELWRPDWKAWVNGAETPVFQVNGLLCGVAVPPGDSEVEIRLVPSRFFRLLVFAAVTGWVALGGEFFLWRRRKSGRAVSQSSRTILP
jgi:hypothetical protein